MPRRPKVPLAFRNMLCVLSAEGIRRRGDMVLAEAAMESCSNPLFVQLWTRWVERLKSYRDPAAVLAKKG